MNVNVIVQRLLAEFWVWIDLEKASVSALIFVNEENTDLL